MMDTVFDSSDLRQIDDLPHFEDFGSIELDIVGTCDRLFAHEGTGMFKYGAGVAVIRHEDLKELAAHPLSGNTPAEELLNWTVEVPDGERGSVGGKAGAALAEVMANHIFTNNPPIHGPLRRMFIQQIGPKAVGLIRENLREIANQLVTQNVDKGSIDFSRDIATAMTARVAGLIFGLTEDEQNVLIQGYAAMADFFRLDSSLDQLISADKGAVNVAQIWSEVRARNLASHEPNPFKSLEEALAKIEFNPDDPIGGSPPKNAAALLAANMLDLVHTGSLLAPCVLYRLLLEPRALSELRANPALITTAVSEVARLSAPVRQVPRYALGDIIYKGLFIPKGTTMYMFWEAGNRDPEAFDAPHEFRLDRPTNVGVTFGGGSHVCPGRHIGIAATQALIGAIVNDALELDLTDESDLWDNMALSRMVPKLPVEIRTKY